MKHPIKLNTYMFNLLINKEMDRFSVIELRNALIRYSEDFTDINEARKYVYRQLMSFQRKGWLSQEGSGRGKIYVKTPFFFEQEFVARGEVYSASYAKLDAEDSLSTLSILRTEKNTYEGELAIVLGEIDEYQSLIGRFPKSISVFMPHFDSAKERSARILGKINALTTVLQALKLKAAAC